MQNLQSDIERIRAKQFALRELKINNLLKEKQEEFDHYISSLDKEENCEYMTGISGIINLCNNPLNCKFKGEVYRSFATTPRKECLRERILRFEKILEH